MRWSKSRACLLTVRAELELADDPGCGRKYENAKVLGRFLASLQGMVLLACAIIHQSHTISDEHSACCHRS